MSKLYIIPTPIGNLDDITFRAIKLLKEVDLVLAEDTRVSSKLLSLFQISTSLSSFHAYNEHRELRKIIQKLKSGLNVALISDAGTPSISDPGFLIVRECIRENIIVECLPGATAFVPAIVNSGLPNDRFVFEGFLPAKKGRTKRLKALETEKLTMVFYESPHRINKTLKDFMQYFGAERQISISREISKIHEETVRGSIEEIMLYFEKKNKKGEIVIVVQGKNE